MNKTIIFDLMGNDNGPEAGIQASIDFLKNNKYYKIILVGDQKQIEQFVQPNEQIEIFHSPKVVDKNSNDLLKSYKEENSMNDALKLLKENKGEAILSSGDSGKYLSSSIMLIKRLENVSRPAFMSIIPTIKENKKFILLDEGANLNNSEEYLIQWAQLGAVFSKNILNIEKPTVSILNIGTENNKGFEYHQKANQYLLNSKNDFDYKGFIESRTLLEGNCDVVVADGYSGNMTLKALEGTILSFTKLLKSKIKKNFWRKFCAFMMKGAFKDIKEQLDYRNVGAAWIIGLNKIVIKAHGSSDKKAYIGALNQIKLAIESNALEKFKNAINKEN